MNRAIFLKEMKWVGRVRHYRLEPPLVVERWDGELLQMQYIVVSAANVFDMGVMETMAFAADEDGEVTDWTELACIRGEDDNDGALRELGYVEVRELPNTDLPRLRPGPVEGT